MSQNWVVRVEDSGVGLDAETAEKIFNPFCTTKPHGIGMGLSISRSIIEAHEGRLWASPRRRHLPIYTSNSFERFR
jgi:C4-dicarboxylate-specific signal transduction histidine kinase